MASDELTDQQLREKLTSFGVTVGPVTGTTRNVYLKKLDRLEKDAGGKKVSKAKVAAEPKAKTTPVRTQSQSTTKARRQDSPAKAAAVPKIQVVVPNDSDSETGEPLRSTTRSSARKKTSVKETNNIVPGEANLSSNGSRSFSIAVDRQQQPTAADVSKYTRVATSRSDTSSFRRKQAVTADSFDFSDSDDVISTADASANTSFLPPGSRSPGFTSTFTRGKQATTTSFDRFTPTVSPISGNSVSGFGRAPISSPPPQTPNRPIVVPTAGSPFRDVLQSLNRFRSTAYNRLKVKFGGWNSKQLPSASFKARDVIDEYRQNKNVFKQKYGRFGEPLKIVEPQRKAAGENISRYLLLFILSFVAVLAVAYLATAHHDSVAAGAGVVKIAAMDTVDFIYKNMIIPFVVITLICGIVGSIYLIQRYRTTTKEHEQKQVFDMVGRITEILEEHKESTAESDKDDCLAIPHVRDMLIRPSDRRVQGAVWERAVAYVNEYDSRVSTETKIVNGQQCLVWRWLPSANAGVGAKKWQGDAFGKDVSAQSLNSLPNPYSECLKLRGMFDATEETEDGWPDQIQDALLEKIGPGIKAVHIAVDRASAEGCVYMKFLSKGDAGDAFRKLHGCWFGGRLISVKYLRPERYTQRFPGSRNSVIPLEARKDATFNRKLI